MRTIGRTALTATLMCTLALPAVSQAADRMTDQQIKQQMEQTERALHRFIDGMNPQIRTAVLRSEGSEIIVKNVLEDLKNGAKVMRERFNPPTSSAGAEVLAFMKDMKKFDAGIAKRPNLSGADAKWADVIPELTKLGAPYHIDWNADPGAWQATRIADAEVKTATATLKKQTEEVLKKLGAAMKKDKAMDASARADATKKLTALAAEAKGFEQVLKSKGDPSAALGRLKAAGGDVRAVFDGYAGAAVAGPAWRAASATLETLFKAFDVAY